MISDGAFRKRSTTSNAARTSRRGRVGVLALASIRASRHVSLKSACHASKEVRWLAASREIRDRLSSLIGWLQRPIIALDHASFEPADVFRKRYIVTKYLVLVHRIPPDALVQQHDTLCILASESRL